MSFRYTEKTYLLALNNVTDLALRNKYLYQFCKGQKHGKELCTNRKFLSAACHLIPWKLMKLVRLKLSLMKPFLEDPEHADLQVILLVRDPRAVMNSRRGTVSWCTQDLDDCASPGTLCEDMQDDLESAREFQSQFPGRVHVLRYEDLMYDPVGVSTKLFDKLGLNMTDGVMEFLESHTKIEVESPWSTVRNSRKRLLYWTQKTSKTDLNEVQEVCAEAMLSYGYNIVHSLKNLSIEDVIGPIDGIIR